ncbi:DUF4150 domain-containing protein [Polyangium mundeleinium]|uniref:DUF4150 domain-containing protein n=1 Tax=Polyangium mundeleinium TaxID=2995306 RepID=A0ABT5F952_9BACT|nr:DUF4150 domain-containing protein [Polyangium mundeleinium]MDC0749943.1 DUF4150 domain-containing protein [Polyangium mundeleinium]
MSYPREGSRGTPEGLVISTCPDVCLTPVGSAMVPVPYSIVAKQSDHADTTKSVRMTRLRTHTTGSIITTCTGDSPGTGKGIKSGTTEGICEPKTFSPTVRAEGKNIIRHSDEWWMNNENTVGKLVYVKDTRVHLAQAATGAMTDVRPSTSLGSRLKNQSTSGDARGGLLAQIANFLTFGRMAQRQVEFEINALQAVLDAPTTPPFSQQERQLLQAAIDDIKAHDLPEGNVESAAAKRTKAIEAANVRVSTSKELDEICNIACQCMANKGEHRTYTDCVAAKLREKYYDPNSGQHPKGGFRRPKSPTADGPRPEVNYRPDGKGGYEPILSVNDDGMPSNVPVVRDAARPDISWWKGGALWKIFELKFTQSNGGIDPPTTMQQDGVYEDIADSQGLTPGDVITVDIKEHCVCTEGGGKAK